MGKIAQCPSCQQQLRLAKPDATDKASHPGLSVTPPGESGAESPGFTAIAPRRRQWLAFLSGALGGTAQRIVLLLALTLLLTVTLYCPYPPKPRSYIGPGGPYSTHTPGGRSFLFTSTHGVDIGRLMLEWASIGLAAVSMVLLVNLVCTEGVRQRMGRAVAWTTRPLWYAAGWCQHHWAMALGIGGATAILVVLLLSPWFWRFVGQENLARTHAPSPPVRPPSSAQISPSKPRGGIEEIEDILRTPAPAAKPAALGAPASGRNMEALDELERIITKPSPYETETKDKAGAETRQLQETIDAAWGGEQMKLLEVEYEWRGSYPWCTIYNGSEGTLTRLTVRVTYRRNDKTLHRDIDLLPNIGCRNILSRRVASMEVHAGVEKEEFVSLEALRAWFTRP